MRKVITLICLLLVAAQAISIENNQGKDVSNHRPTIMEMNRKLFTFLSGFVNKSVFH